MVLIKSVTRRQEKPGCLRSQLYRASDLKDVEIPYEVVPIEA